MRAHILAFLSFLLFLASQVASAQTFTGTIAGGMGNAGRAAFDGSESAFLNPASVAYFNNYVVSGFYQTGDLNPTISFNRYALQISDGTENNILPGALSFVQNTIQRPNGLGDFTQTDFQASLGELVFSRFAVGVSIHHLIQKGDGVSDRQTNGSLGLIFTPTDKIGLAFVAYDLVPGSDSVEESRQLKPAYSLGSNFILGEMFSLRADVVKPGVGSRGRADFGFGIQSYFNEFLAVRLGAQWRETASETNITAGLGYRGPRFSIDYSFQQDTRVAGSMRHLVDLWLPL